MTFLCDAQGVKERRNTGKQDPWSWRRNGFGRRPGKLSVWMFRFFTLCCLLCVYVYVLRGDHDTCVCVAWWSCYVCMCCVVTVIIMHMWWPWYVCVVTVIRVIRGDRDTCVLRGDRDTCVLRSDRDTCVCYRWKLVHSSKFSKKCPCFTARNWKTTCVDIFRSYCNKPPPPKLEQKIETKNCLIKPPPN